MKLLDQFVMQVIAHSTYTEDDVCYLRNRVMALVGEDGVDVEMPSESLLDLKSALIKVALSNGKVGETAEEQDCLGAELMNFITPPPSVVNRHFWESYHYESPEKAIADFYELSKRNDYIKVNAISKNIYFQTSTEYGNLEITINLSKPEKDPKAIAMARNLKVSGYPACQLCIENEGYQGRINYPARANHRIIQMNLGGKKWGFQYSPYAYFNEHSIVLDTEHVPMVISQNTFAQLFDLTDLLPGYFVGSNADLPIVGGSILTHNHYQAGRHTFAMEVAPVEHSFVFAGFEDIVAGIVKWPMSVIRLQGQDKEKMVELAEKIRLSWHQFSDNTVDIVAESHGEPHHTITPIARRKNGVYELDLVLRDNHVSDVYPDGVYHPHRDVQHIKKENIGLIEVMGLAIFPPRLKTELEEVEKFLLGQSSTVAEYHQAWADRLKAEYPQVNLNNVSEIVKQSVGKIFARILEDAGVYKRDEQGQAAFMRFVESMGLVQNG